MKLLFIIDAPARLNPKKDSTIALMRAAARRGDAVFYAEIEDLTMTAAGVFVRCAQLQVSEDDAAWMTAADAKTLLPADSFDTVLMRKEPPVDAHFITAAQLLERVRVPVVNHPQALRDLNEKLSIFNFPELIMPTVVTADRERLTAFWREHGEVVLKPTDGFGGGGVYAATPTDVNFYSVLDTLTACGQTAIMAQVFNPAVKTGDYRVFVLAGKPMEWMLQRTPAADDFRANMAVGGAAAAVPINAPCRAIAESVGGFLLARGVRFAGLDIIGEYLTEINITCPTGLQPVQEQAQADVADVVLSAMVAPCGEKLI